MKLPDLSASDATPCELSVVIKALNEATNIERTLRCAIEAVKGRNAEVILADSLSSDRTVAIASTLPVRIVQLMHATDRSCGVGAQLGYQFALGRYILVMDGDMDLQKDFVDAALKRLDQDSGLGGVGGIIVDVNFDNIEYRARRARAPVDAVAGPVDRLNGGGLFRRAAIVDIGYLTNRNLHACEELEQALRLCSSGWRLERLSQIAVYHHGHTAATWALMARRWRSRYVCGAGELLHAAVGQPYFWDAARTQRHLFVVLGWWVALMLLLAGAMVSMMPTMWGAWLALALLPHMLMSWRKRSLTLGVYSVASWCLDTGGMLRGLMQRQCDPRAPIEARELTTMMGR
jgi:glycosyltransferase involved in cell wall biosynthesis